MQGSVRMTVIILLAIIGLILGGFFFNYIKKPALDISQLDNINARILDQARIIKPFSLIDHQNNAFTNENLQGKWSLLFFGFTFCPDICPTTLSTLNHVQTKLELSDQIDPTSIQVILVSVDPERDTPEKLATYVHHFNSKFIGVTGTIKTIQPLAYNLNVSFIKSIGEAPENYLVDHSGQIVLINPKGDYYGFIKNPHSAENIVKFLQISQAYYQQQQP